MSGYRSLHREQVLAKETALWCVEATPLLLTTAKSSSSTSGSSSGSATSGHGSNQWRIWIASSDGYVRSYTAIESSIDNDDHNSLDASALSLTCTHILTGRTTKEPPPPLAEDDDAPSRPAMGCTRVCTVRNYVGEDDAVGDLIVASLDLGGTIRVWRFPADWDEKNSTGSSDSQLLQPNKQVKCMAEFELENAAGTTMALRVIPVAQEVAVAVGCLNGTIAIVSTGIATPNAKKEAQAAGTILDTWGSSGTATPVSLAWHPVLSDTAVVGRQDGVVDILSSTKKNIHRLLRLNTSPTRAVAYTPDGNLLLAGNDAGMMCVWDVNRPGGPVLVHHVLRAHPSWILDVACLPDSRHFVTVGAERQIHVWLVGQLAQNQPLHTFQLDSSVWTVSLLHNTRKKEQAPRMVTGSDTGWLQVFSLAN